MAGLVELNRTVLAALPGSVHSPRFDPVHLKPGIVHLGLGGFHRAHMARYTHDVMEHRPDGLRWGIIGASLILPRMQQCLAPQDNLYTLVERSSAGETVTVIGSLASVMFAGNDSSMLLDEIARPNIRIVSLTVTESGYCLNSATKQLDPEHPLIRKDLAYPARPSSAIGIVVEGLRRRMIADEAPFTALSCDNIQHNGEVLKQAVLALARLRDQALADWISARVGFPNTMVDRITPVTTEADVAWLASHYGIADRCAVFCETFRQWVIEDRFGRGRPAWEEAGAQFVDDVGPHEFMKLRLLNASHLAVAGLGRLMGYSTIDQAIADPLLTRYVRALMDRETGPTLPHVPGIDLTAYKAQLIERFANTAIRDSVERVNTDAPLNVLVDPIRDRLRAGAPISLLALGLAAWLRRVRGEDEQGKSINVRHPLAELLRQKAIEGGDDPRPLLGICELFGELGTDPRVVGPVGVWLGSLYRHGSCATIADAARTFGL